MADKTLTVNGQPFTINRDRKAEVSQLTVNGQPFNIDRTAPVIESDPVGKSRPLLDKLVGGAAAAYSLRDLNSKQGDTDVVNVRRSTDNEEKVFKAKDVSKISDWVGGKQDTTLPCDVATAAGAYSLRKVNSTHGEEKVLFSGLDELPWDDANSVIYTDNSGNAAGQSFGSNGLNFRRMASTTNLNNSISYSNGILRLESTATAERADFQNILRITNLPANKRFTLTGQVRVAKNNLTGTEIAPTLARIDFNDDHDQIAKFGNTAFQPFSMTQGWNQEREDASAVYNFFDIQLYADGSGSANDIVGTAAVEFKDLKIIENPNYAVRVRRGDNIEADVKFDYFDKVSLDSEIVNATEDNNASVHDTDQGGTSTRTLRDFLSESNFSDIAVNSFVGSTRNANDNLYVEEFTPHVNGFTAEAKFAGMGASDTVRCHATLPYLISEADAAASKFKVTFTIDEISGQGSASTAGKLYLKASNNTLNAGGTYFLQNTQNLTSASDQVTSTFNTPGTHTLEGYSYQGGNHTFGGFTFTVYTGTRVKVSNIKYEILHTATVNTWYNQANFVDDAIQQDSTKQPRIASNGVLLADGISFDGTNDFLNTDGVFTDNRSASIFTKVKALTSDASGTNWFYTEGYSGENGSVSQTIGVGITDTGNIADITASTDINASDGKASSLATGGVISLIGGSSTSASNINGVQMGSITTPTNADGNYTITTSGGIGGHSSTSSLAKFSIDELLLYTSDQSSNRFKIESNINNYYGLYNDEYEWDAATNTEWQNNVTDGATTFTPNGKDGFTITATGENKSSFKYKITSPSSASNNYYRVSFFVDDPDGLFDDAQLRLTATGAGATAQTISNGFNSMSLRTGANFEYMSINSDGGGSSKTATISNFKISRIVRDGFVEILYDQSGNGRDMTQSNDNYQPKIVSNGSVCKTNNGYHAMLFDGSNDFLSTSTYEPADEPNGMTDFNLVCVTGRPPTFTNRAVASAGSQEGSHTIGGFYFSNNQNSGDSTKQDIRFNISEHDETTTTSSHIDQKIISATPLQDTNLLSFNRIGSDNTFESYKMDGTTFTGTSLVPKTGQSAASGAAFKIGASMYHASGRKHYPGQILEVVFYDSNNRNNAVAINHNVKNQYQI
tara:strand:- start:461 stop:3856 length:3396 start_codon:yes stop_codon:yes gene_type:complete